MLTEGQKTNNAICVASNGSAAGHHCSERAAGFILWKRQERLKFEKAEDCPPPTVRLTGSLAFLHKSDVLSPKTTTHAPRQKWIERKIRCRRNWLRVRVLLSFSDPFIPLYFYFQKTRWKNMDKIAWLMLNTHCKTKLMNRMLNNISNFENTTRFVVNQCSSFLYVSLFLMLVCFRDAP